jgi:hypothetical protein
MRRRLPPGVGVPPHLATFTETDWPGRTWEDRFRRWCAAQRAWVDAGNDWPGGGVALFLAQYDVHDVHYYGAARRRRFPHEHLPPVHQD